MPRAKNNKSVSDNAPFNVKITHSIGVNVRKAAGLDEEKTPYAVTSDGVVEVSETVTVEGQQWGNIGIGWILLDNLTERA